MSNGEFTFESVTERFAAATAALDTLHQHLGSLAAAQERQATMSDAIGEAAKQLREMVSTLVSTTETAHSSLVDLRKALTGAAEFLQGSQVEALRTRWSLCKRESPQRERAQRPTPTRCGPPWSESATTSRKNWSKSERNETQRVSNLQPQATGWSDSRPRSKQSPNAPDRSSACDRSAFPLGGSVPARGRGDYPCCEVVTTASSMISTIPSRLERAHGLSKFRICPIIAEAAAGSPRAASMASTSNSSLPAN